MTPRSRRSRRSSSLSTRGSSQMTQLSSAMPAAASTSSSGNPRSTSSRAQLEGAQWNLDKTVVRAPADGYVTNLALRKGARVANLPLSPVMAFIDTSKTIIGVEINQNNARYIAPGQEVEIPSSSCPARSMPARSKASCRRWRAGRRRCRAGGHAKGDRDRAFHRARRAGRRRVRASAAGRQHRRLRRSTPNMSRSSHVVRSVLLRQVAILNYVNPF